MQRMLLLQKVEQALVLIIENWAMPGFFMYRMYTVCHGCMDAQDTRSGFFYPIEALRFMTNPKVI